MQYIYFFFPYYDDSYLASMNTSLVWQYQLVCILCIWHSSNQQKEFRRTMNTILLLASSSTTTSQSSSMGFYIACILPDYYYYQLEYAQVVCVVWILCILYQLSLIDIRILLIILLQWLYCIVNRYVRRVRACIIVEISMMIFIDEKHILCKFKAR